MGEQRFESHGQEVVDVSANNELALMWFGFERAQVFGGKMKNPFFVDGPPHNIAENGHLQIDRACRHARLLARRNETVDMDSFDLVQPHVPEVGLPPVDGILLRLKGGGSLGILGLPIKRCVGVSKVGKLRREFEDRQISFEAMDKQFREFLVGLSRGGGSFQRHTPNLLLAGVFVLDRQLGIIAPAVGVREI